MNHQVSVLWQGPQNIIAIAFPYEYFITFLIS